MRDIFIFYFLVTTTKHTRFHNQPMYSNMIDTSSSYILVDTSSRNIQHSIIKLSSLDLDKFYVHVTRYSRLPFSSCWQSGSRISRITLDKRPSKFPWSSNFIPLKSWSRGWRRTTFTAVTIISRAPSVISSSVLFVRSI